MKIKITLLLIFACISFLNAQIYTPGGLIGGSSGSNNIGIGTANPLAKLEVNNGDLLIRNLANVNNESAIMIGQSVNAGPLTTFGTSIRTFTQSAGNNGYAMQFFTQESYLTKQTEKMRIQGNGNIGIGTSNPSANLEIAAPAITGSETLLKLSVSDAPQDYLKIANGTNADAQFIPAIEGSRNSDNRSVLYLTGSINTGVDNGVNPIMVFDSRLSNAAVVARPLFAWDSYGNRKMTLNSNGSLGIGTSTTGTHKLAVEGSIAAREIKVMATGWADFVFKKEYNLPTLEEVEKHIAEKGHLENIPNEKEVLANGINLGEMNAKLLQKIEELTLYVIDQNKKIEGLTKETKMLKEDNKSFKSILESDFGVKN